MRRGRTVQIINVFSDLLNLEYDKSAFLKSDCKLFQTLVTAAANVLSPKQLYVRCSVDSQRPRVSGTQLSCANVGDLLAIISQVARGMTGLGPIDERRYLEHNTLPDRQPVKLTILWDGQISWRPLPTWRQRSVLTAGSKTLRSFWTGVIKFLAVHDISYFIYMGCSDVSEFEHIYGQMTMTPSCVYDPVFTWTRMTALVRWSCDRSW